MATMPSPSRVYLPLPPKREEAWLGLALCISPLYSRGEISFSLRGRRREGEYRRVGDGTSIGTMRDVTLSRTTVHARPYRGWKFARNVARVVSPVPLPQPSARAALYKPPVFPSSGKRSQAGLLIIVVWNGDESQDRDYCFGNWVDLKADPWWWSLWRRLDWIKLRVLPDDRFLGLESASFLFNILDIWFRFDWYTCFNVIVRVIIYVYINYIRIININERMFLDNFRFFFVDVVQQHFQSLPSMFQFERIG